MPDVTREKRIALMRRIAQMGAFQFEEAYRLGHPDAAEYRGLGMTIAQWAQFDDYIICEVFASALEEANSHELAAQVRETMKKMALEFLSKE